MTGSLDPARFRRFATGAAVLALHVAIGYGLLFALAGRDRFRGDRHEPILLITDMPQPPRERPHQAKSGPGKSRPAPAAPRAPRLTAPPPPQIAVLAPVPAPLSQPEGQGTGGGLGGIGIGTGAGGDGMGGGGGDPPEQIGGRISGRDYPRSLSGAGISGTVGVRYRVTVDGRARDCTITRSSGHAELDALTCSLIEDRFRFRPARDADGHPVRSIIVEKHSWIIPSSSPDQSEGDDKWDDGEE